MHNYQSGHHAHCSQRKTRFPLLNSMVPHHMMEGSPSKEYYFVIHDIVCSCANIGARHRRAQIEINVDQCGSLWIPRNQIVSAR